LAAVSFVLEIRFFTKELRTALFYLPACLFNVFAAILMLTIALNN